MDKITVKDIARLDKPKKNFVVSIYMPTHKVSNQEIWQDQIQFKNLIADAHHQLEALGVDETTVSKQLAPGKQLVHDDYFWTQLSQGLAVFLGPKTNRIYRLPYEFREMVAVDTRYHIKQLLMAVGEKAHYYVLKLSPRSVRLYRATAGEIEPVEEANIPKDITEALGHDDNERLLSHHVGESSASGAGQAVFHGHGNPKDHKQIDKERFVRSVANRTARVLRNSEAPLVLAGVDELLHIYRDTYPHTNLHREQLNGNHDDAKSHELHELVLPIIEADRQSRMAEVIERYQQLRAQQPGLTTENLTDIINYAHQGRIDTVFLNQQSTCWGTVEEGAIKRHEHQQLPGLSDLGDVAAAYTFANSGDVHILEPDTILENAEAAAILRY